MGRTYVKCHRSTFNPGRHAFENPVIADSGSIGKSSS